MRKYLFHFAMAGLIILAFCSCRLTGPTDRDVFEAMEAVMRGFETSMDQDTLEISDAYSNAADAVFRNEDDSVVTNMTALINDNRLHVYGTSLFSEYHDTSSNYRLNGEFIYNIKSAGSYNSANWFGEMGCTVELSGGKIETLEFTFIIAETGEFEEFFITANDIEIDVTQEDSLIDILNRFSRGMPG
jgi:hypothetical protein